MIRVRIRQCPVGQGGFAIGTVSKDGKATRSWAYDCGSNQRDALIREIQAAANIGPVDTLYLSHLDSDHVSGVELFLQQVGAREAVVPYISEEARVALVAEAVMSGTLTKTLLDFVNDPVAWFRSRECQSVTFIDSADNERAPADALDDKLPIDQWTWTRNLRVVDGISIASAGAVFGNRELAWVFAPYAHQPSRKRLEDFHEAVTKHFFLKGGSVDVLELVKDANSRDELAALYEEFFWTNANLVSLSLYCGPSKQSEWTWIIGGHLWRRDWGGAAGWMKTGDTELTGKRRLQTFLNFYDHYTALVGVLVVPHHGSARSSDHRLIEALPSLTFGVAAAGPNSYDHPNSSVREAIEDTGKHFVHVNQHSHSALDIVLEA